MFRKQIKSKTISKSQISQDDTKIVNMSSHSKSKTGSCPLDPLPCDPCSIFSPCNPLYWCCAANLMNFGCCFQEFCGQQDCCDN